MFFNWGHEIYISVAQAMENTILHTDWSIWTDAAIITCEETVACSRANDEFIN